MQLAIIDDLRVGIILDAGKQVVRQRLELAPRRWIQDGKARHSAAASLKQLGELSLVVTLSNIDKRRNLGRLSLPVRLMTRRALAEINGASCGCRNSLLKRFG